MHLWAFTRRDVLVCNFVHCETLGVRSQAERFFVHDFWEIASVDWAGGLDEMLAFWISTL